MIYIVILLKLPIIIVQLFKSHNPAYL